MREMCEPRLRWMLAHELHKKIPIVYEAQSGSGSGTGISHQPLPRRRCRRRTWTLAIGTRSVLGTLHQLHQALSVDRTHGERKTQRLPDCTGVGWCFSLKHASFARWSLSVVDRTDFATDLRCFLRFCEINILRLRKTCFRPPSALLPLHQRPMTCPSSHPVLFAGPPTCHTFNPDTRMPSRHMTSLLPSPSFQ